MLFLKHGSITYILFICLCGNQIFSHRWWRQTVNYCPEKNYSSFDQLMFSKPTSPLCHNSWWYTGLKAPPIRRLFTGILFIYFRVISKERDFRNSFSYFLSFPGLSWLWLFSFLLYFIIVNYCLHSIIFVPVQKIMVLKKKKQASHPSVLNTTQCSYHWWLNLSYTFLLLFLFNTVYTPPPPTPNPLLPLLHSSVSVCSVSDSDPWPGAE